MRTGAFVLHRRGYDVLETFEHPRHSWRSPYQMRKEERLARERMKIPICQSCGVRCTVCAPKFGQPARCCLLQPRVYPDTGESGETYDAEMIVAGKLE